jgi:hypothetical protein
MEFQPFSKIARFSRDIVITEKIDGTNAQLLIVADFDPLIETGEPVATNGNLSMFAGSRNRWLTPGKLDNYGFAGWAAEHAEELFALGEGRHFGEWWGKGIQRGYGEDRKRFSLFNTHRWRWKDSRPECCDVVPVLYQGIMDQRHIEGALELLKHGSVAATASGSKAEGIVIFHTASGTLFKKTIEHDESPKGQLKDAQ